jgi:hypothetical protein
MPTHQVDWTPEQLASIGSFAIEFGHLEDALYGAVIQLSDVPRGVADILMGRSGASDNRDRVKQLLKLRLPKDRHLDVDTLMDRLAKVATFRNALLHSPPLPIGNVVWSSDGDVPEISEDERHEMMSGKLGVVTPKKIDEKTLEAHAAWQLLSKLWIQALTFPIPD